jgi:hypothetical protein
MFYLQLALIYEDFASGRMNQATYEESIILLAQDHERLKSESRENILAA